MKWLWVLAGLTVFVAWYTSPIGREWLKTVSWMQWYYRSAFAERVETLLFKKSDALLFERFRMFLAAAWTFLLSIGQIDPSPFLIFIPQEYHTAVLAVPTVLLAIDGVLGEIRRRYITKPVDVVAIPEAKPIPADVADRLAELEKAKADLMATLDVAKAEGAV